MRESIRNAVRTAAAVMLVLGAARAAQAQNDETTTRHIYWDTVDKCWYCIGSPIDCDVAVENPGA